MTLELSPCDYKMCCSCRKYFGLPFLMLIDIRCFKSMKVCQAISAYQNPDPEVLFGKFEGTFE